MKTTTTNTKRHQMNAFTTKLFTADDFATREGLEKVYEALKAAICASSDEEELRSLRDTASDAAAVVRGCAWNIRPSVTASLLDQLAWDASARKAWVEQQDRLARGDW